MDIIIERGSSKEKKIRNKGSSLLSIPENYTVLDIETTGLDPYYDSIIEVSAIKCINGVPVNTYTSLVKPDAYYYVPDEKDIDITDFIIHGSEKIYYIDSFITELTGITNSMLETAPETITVMKELQDFLGNDIILGHNVNFDINFIYDNFKRYLNVEFKNDFIDTMRLSRRVLTELKHHRLKDIANYYQLDTTGSHRALKDCEITNSCFIALQKTISDTFGSFKELINSIKKHSSGIRAIDIVSNNTDFDISHPLYNKVCVFTGTLEKMIRKDAMQIVANLGGINADSVTSKTNYLILGNNDYCKLIKDGKSNKQKKAEKLKLEGHDIEIITENVFYDIISQ